MTDYKELCTELLAWAEKTSSHYYKQPDVILRTRAALSESEGPTDKELAELYRKSYHECKNRQGDAAQIFALRAVLARWGK
jgi:hypothetical protein